MKHTLTLAGMLFGLQLVAQNAPVGPDAPELEVTWANGYTLTLTDPPNSNNAGQNYQEFVPALAGTPDPFWTFQGYLVFQVLPGFVPIGDNCFDPTMARLIGQSDIVDGISTLVGVRHLYIDSMGIVLIDTCFAEAVIGANAGLQFTYAISVDAFTNAPFDPQDTVCFLALAYATNPWNTDSACVAADGILTGRKSANGSVRTVCVNALTAGVREAGDPEAFKLWPVPANEGLQWTATQPTTALRIVNVLGELVYSSSRTANAGSVDVTGLTTGSYAITFEFSSGMRTTRTFMVIH
jgi:hypothetical protein